MHANEDLQSHVTWTNEAADMLACLEVYRDEEETLDTIICGLTTKNFEINPLSSSANPVSAVPISSHSLWSDMKDFSAVETVGDVMPRFQMFRAVAAVQVVGGGGERRKHTSRQRARTRSGPRPRPQQQRCSSWKSEGNQWL